MIVIVFSIITAVLLYAIIYKKYITTKAVSKSFNLPLKIQHTITLNCYQLVNVYEVASKKEENSNNKITYHQFICAISSTVSLAKNFDPIHYLYGDQKEYFYINIMLNTILPCFYVYNKRWNLKHIGKSLSKPYLLNKTNYVMLGNITDDIYTFCEKYNFIHLYCSYVPDGNLVESTPNGTKVNGGKANGTNLVSGHKHLNYHSNLELKFNIEGIKNGSVEQIYYDLIKCISNVEEKEKKYKRIIGEYNVIANGDARKNSNGLLSSLMKNK